MAAFPALASSSGSALLSLAERGDEQTLLDGLAHARGGTVALQTKRDGETLAHICARRDWAVALEQLAALHPVLVSQPRRDGHTPLHVAACAEAGRAVEVLLSLGASPLALSACGKVPRMYLSEGSPLAAQLLAREAAAAAAQGRASGAPVSLLAALRQRDRQAVSALLARAESMGLGENALLLYERKGDGSTALHELASLDWAAELRCLAALGADVDAVRGSDGWTALHCAAQANSLEAARALVDDCAAVFIANKLGRTAIAYAKSEQMRELLVMWEARANMHWDELDAAMAWQEGDGAPPAPYAPGSAPGPLGRRLRRGVCERIVKFIGSNIVHAASGLEFGHALALTGRVSQGLFALATRVLLGWSADLAALWRLEGATVVSYAARAGAFDGSCARHSDGGALSINICLHASADADGAIIFDDDSGAGMRVPFVAGAVVVHDSSHMHSVVGLSAGWRVCLLLNLARVAIDGAAAPGSLATPSNADGVASASSSLVPAELASVCVPPPEVGAVFAILDSREYEEADVFDLNPGVGFSTSNVLLLGMHGVGKTAHLISFHYSRWLTELSSLTETDSYRKRFVLLDHAMLISTIDPGSVECDLPDLTCMEKWSLAAHVRHSDLFCLFFDVTRAESFAALGHIMQAVLHLKDKAYLPVTLVATHTDAELALTRVISREKGSALAQAWGAGYVELSKGQSDYFAKAFVHAQLVRAVLDGRRIGKSDAAPKRKCHVS